MRVKEVLIEEHERNEMMQGLMLWSALNTVALTISNEVKETGDSATLADLYEKIKENYSK